MTETTDITPDQEQQLSRITDDISKCSNRLSRILNQCMGLADRYVLLLERAVRREEGAFDALAAACVRDTGASAALEIPIADLLSAHWDWKQSLDERNELLSRISSSANQTATPIIEPWRRVWREGIAPLLSEKALEALQQALTNDDPRLIQGKTMVPPYWKSRQNAPVEAAGALAYCGWQGEGLETIGAVESFFLQLCIDIGLRLDEPMVSKCFIDWYDETPRQQMRTQLLSEVHRELLRRMVR
jgi:hypothetical protein